MEFRGNVAEYGDFATIKFRSTIICSSILSINMRIILNDRVRSLIIKGQMFTKLACNTICKLFYTNIGILPDDQYSSTSFVNS